MSYAIGCIGSPVEGRTSKPRMTAAQRAANNRLIPRKPLRHQDRDIAFIEIKPREGNAPAKVRAIKNGTIHEYETALFFHEMRYLTNPNGSRKIVRNPRRKR